MEIIPIDTTKNRDKSIGLINGLHFSANYYVIILTWTKRTLKQNRLYWAWMNCISDDTGQPIMTLHDQMRKLYLGYKIAVVDGEEVEVLVSTTDLDRRQFSSYLNHISAEAAEADIYLPYPGDEGFNQFYNRYKIGIL